MCSEFFYFYFWSQETLSTGFLLELVNNGVFVPFFVCFRSVRTACQTLAQPNKNISDAVDARQELDLRIGGLFLNLFKLIVLISNN